MGVNIAVSPRRYQRGRLESTAAPRSRGRRTLGENCMRTPLAETGAAGKKPRVVYTLICVGTNDDAS